MANPRVIKLVDASFKEAHSFGFAGENRGEKPELIQWDRSQPTADDTVVFTDSFLFKHKDYPARRRIALLIESPAIRPGIYKWIETHFDEFDIVFTHQRYLVEFGYPFLFYALGGSWINEWDIFPKSKMTSILLSFKTGTDGHKLRHQVAKLSNVDTYGSGVGEYVLPPVALRDYRFTVVIENTKSDAYFSEKLIDAISQGCVPIYWGCPNIRRFFNPAGMIFWDDIEELDAILKSLRPEDYVRHLPYLNENFERAKEFRCPEDWIMRVYPGEFNGRNCHNGLSPVGE